MAERSLGVWGFSVVQGPELETEHYNFDALNIPEDHSSRDMWDTFWVKTKKEGEESIATHTSPMQIRWLEKQGAPTRIVVPGKCFRNEATDMTHGRSSISSKDLR